MQFTCHGILRKWIFRGVRGQEAGVQLTTWRQTPFTTQYQRVSITSRNTARITLDGSVFTYEPTTPVHVQPGDVLGIEMQFVPQSNNILSLDIIRTGSVSLSYRRSLGLGSTSVFGLQSLFIFREQRYVPLIEAVIGKLTYNISFW